MSGHWNPEGNYTVINSGTFLLSHASIDLILDIMILCLPLPMITKLQMPFRRKVVLVAIFWLGFL